MVIVTARGGASIVRKVSVRLDVFEGCFMTMGAVVGRNCNGHFAGDLVIVFLVAGDTAHGIDVLEKNGVFRVLEFSDRMGVVEFLEVFTVAVHTSGVRHPRVGEDVLVLFIRMTSGAVHLDLIVSVSRDSGKEWALVFGSQKYVG